MNNVGELQPLYNQIKKLYGEREDLDYESDEMLTENGEIDDEIIDISADLMEGEVPYVRPYYDGTVVRRYMVRNFEVRAVDVDYAEFQDWTEGPSAGVYVLAFDDAISEEFDQDFYIKKDLLYQDRLDAIRTALTDTENYIGELENMRDYYLTELED